MIKKTASLLVIIFFTLSLHAQDSKQLQDTFLEAEYLFMNEDYSEALNYYLQIYSEKSENANLAFCIGVCYINMPGKKELAVKYLEEAAKNMSAKHKEGTLNQIAAPYDALYELARAYRINYNFEKAKEAYLKYKKTLLADDTENIGFIDHEIEVCDMAKILIDKPVTFTMENLGEIFNDNNSNFNPAISSDGKSFVFMSSLKFYDAIMFSQLQNNKWGGPVNIYPDLKIDGDVVISSLTKDGRQLFISKDDNFNSDIYVSSFNGTVWSPAIKLNKNINTKYWESHASISEDDNLLIFASDKPGGFGGLDLYISRKVNGEWGPAVNMGPEINTVFNEDRAFLANHDKTLFFSSQGHENMGGYDLFRSEKLSSGSWKKPENMGYPLNTTDDNTYFMPSADGKSGYLFLDKETDGFGREDLYRIILK
ncbi:MAG: PD40 domain-containing protein [Bacteroidetes bacterium]|nr:PD40 domain-containing protein [Bacteroidota bacterium]